MFIVPPAPSPVSDACSCTKTLGTSLGSSSYSACSWVYRDRFKISINANLGLNYEVNIEGRDTFFCSASFCLLLFGGSTVAMCCVYRRSLRELSAEQLRQCNRATAQVKQTNYFIYWRMGTQFFFPQIPFLTSRPRHDDLIDKRLASHRQRGGWVRTRMLASLVLTSHVLRRLNNFRLYLLYKWLWCEKCPFIVYCVFLCRFCIIDVFTARKENILVALCEERLDMQLSWFLAPGEKQKNKK